MCYNPCIQQQYLNTYIIISDVKVNEMSCIFNPQGICNWGNEVQLKTDFILGSRKPFSEQLEVERRI